MRRNISIVGGGAAGVLVAIHLTRTASVPLHLTIVEPRERLAEGVAYSTPDSEHLLNVPAAGMSAYVEDALHFVKWAECSPQDFIPRHRYADYLRSELQRLTHVNPHVALQHVRDSAHAISTSPLRVSTVGGPDVLADVVVLALGNAAPFKPDWYSHLTAPVVLDDPWVPGALETIPDQSKVLCVGTGLTFVDVALSLTRRGCRVTGVSRHGFLPHIHAAQSTLPLVPTEFDSPTAVSRWLRSQSDWQAALTALRPHTQVIWQSFSAPQQASFLRHARRYWDVHRHRMSQNVADKLRLAIHRCLVTVLRGDAQRVAAQSPWDAIILCTGPDDAALINTAPLRSLASQGHVRIGPHGKGIDTVPDSGCVRNRDGAAPLDIYAIGPLRQGTLWECTAIPEIRSEAQRLASRVLA
ncbi:MAG: hypothetical protein RLZZ201_629 [Actinomycetota bacterium]